MENSNINTVYGSADVLVACALASRCSINAVTLTIAVPILFFFFFWLCFSVLKNQRQCETMWLRSLSFLSGFFPSRSVIWSFTFSLYAIRDSYDQRYLYRAVHHTRHHTISISVVRVLAAVHTRCYSNYLICFLSISIMIIGISISRYIFVLAWIVVLSIGCYVVLCCALLCYGIELFCWLRSRSLIKWDYYRTCKPQATICCVWDL